MFLLSTLFTSSTLLPRGSTDHDWNFFRRKNHTPREGFFTGKFSQDENPQNAIHGASAACVASKDKSLDDEATGCRIGGGLAKHYA